MDDKTRAGMRNSFKRTACRAAETAGATVTRDDLRMLRAVGLAGLDDNPAGEAAGPCAPVSREEARSLLEQVSSSYSRQKLDGYLEDAQSRVMEAIIRPFGLARVLFAEKDGGDVATAPAQEKFRPQEYRTSRYRATAREMIEVMTVDAGLYRMENPHEYYESSPEDYVVDQYSGREIHPTDADVDHVYAAKRFNDDGGFGLSKEDKRDFGADRDNLVITSSSANRSMGSADKHEWQEGESANGSGKTNKEVHGHDNRRVNAAVKRGEKAAKRYLRPETQKKDHSAWRTGRAGVEEGARMGLQQALGAFLMELARGMWDEVRDVLGSGSLGTGNHQSVLRGILERLSRVGARVLSKWKEIVVAFRDGAMSGFLSSMITTVINMFMTSAKNAVRMIREGFMSLVRGVKFILSPPEGYSRGEAYHESGKIIAGGIAVSLGICAEEAVRTGIAAIPVVGPFIAPLADSIAAVLVGIAVGLGTSFLCYLWDKLDLFGAEEGRRHKFIMDTLDRQRRGATEAADAASAERGRLMESCDRMFAEIEQVRREFWELAAPPAAGSQGWSA